MPLLIFKLIATAIVTLAIVLPIINGSAGSGILREVEALGVLGASIVGLVFLVLVALYCKDLQTTLERASPQHRASKPSSVWYMFLIPYNFVEDFFIIINISKSLQQQATDTDAIRTLQPFGLYSGLTWCTAQILSIAPGMVGQSASLVAIIFWLVHWRFIRKINRLLSTTMPS